MPYVKLSRPMNPQAQLKALLLSLASSLSSASALVRGPPVCVPLSVNESVCEDGV